MYRYFFVARNNIKKQKNDMLTFFILSLLATLLIFVSLSFLTGTGKVFDDNLEKTNGADITIMMQENEALADRIEEVANDEVYIGNTEQENILYICPAKYKGKTEKNWVEYPFVISCYEDEQKIHTLSTDTVGLSGAETIFPISLKTAYDIGDYVQLKVGDNIYNLKVAAFNEDNLFCSSMNMGTYKIFVSRGIYETIDFENPKLAQNGRLIKMKMTDTAKKKNVSSDDLADSMTEVLLKELDKYAADDAFFNVLPMGLMRTACMILPYVFIAIVLLFSIIILIISVVIINFSVKNFIMTNMKNTAIMEAAGYTVRELVLVLLFQLLMVALAGALIGILIGSLLLDKFGIIILITLGLEWNQPVNALVIIGVVLAIAVLVGFLTVLLGRNYSKTSVLDALRGGVNTHSYKKNLFAFDKTSFSIPITLALKSTFGKFKSQIGIVFIMMILAISTVVAFGMADSYGTDEGCVRLAGLDFYDAECMGGQNMADVIASMKTVESTHTEFYTAFRMCNGKIEKTINIRAISDTSDIRGGCVIDGRWPAHANEILLASNASNTLDAGVGDVITVKSDGAEENYIVCGICQVFQNLGNMSYTTLDGVSKLVSTSNDSLDIIINFKQGVTFDEFDKEFKDTYPEVEVIDYNEAVHNTVGTITSGMKLFAYFVSILTIVIVAFVESLIVRTNVNKEWRNLGVSKALGFTSGQLIIQVILSNMPAILIGVAIGTIISPVAGSKLLVAAFSIFGFKKVEFTIKPLSYVLTIIIIIGVAIITAALRGRKIKALEPVKMIMEE